MLYYFHPKTLYPNCLSAPHLTSINLNLLKSYHKHFTLLFRPPNNKYLLYYSPPKNRISKSNSQKISFYYLQYSLHNLYNQSNLYNLSYNEFLTLKESSSIFPVKKVGEKKLNLLNYF
jgi:hypothetical protein